MVENIAFILHLNEAKMYSLSLLSLFSISANSYYVKVLYYNNYTLLIINNDLITNNIILA